MPVSTVSQKSVRYFGITQKLQKRDFIEEWKKLLHFLREHGPGALYKALVGLEISHHLFFSQVFAHFLSWETKQNT